MFNYKFYICSIFLVVQGSALSQQISGILPQEFMPPISRALECRDWKQINHTRGITSNVLPVMKFPLESVPETTKRKLNDTLTRYYFKMPISVWGFNVSEVEVGQFIHRDEVDDDIASNSVSQTVKLVGVSSSNLATTIEGELGIKLNSDDFTYSAEAENGQVLSIVEGQSQNEVPVSILSCGLVDKNIITHNLSTTSTKSVYQEAHPVGMQTTKQPSFRSEDRNLRFLLSYGALAVVVLIYILWKKFRIRATAGIASPTGSLPINIKSQPNDLTQHVLHEAAESLEDITHESNTKTYDSKWTIDKQNERHIINIVGGSLIIFIIDRYITSMSGYGVTWLAWLAWVLAYFSPLLILSYFNWLRNGGAVPIFAFGFGWGYSEARSNGKDTTKSIGEGANTGLAMLIAIPIIIVVFGVGLVKDLVYDPLIYFGFSDPYDEVHCKDCTIAKENVFQKLDFGLRNNYVKYAFSTDADFDQGRRLQVAQSTPKLLRLINTGEYKSIHTSTLGFSALTKKGVDNSKNIDIDIYNSSTGSLLMNLHLTDVREEFFLPVTYSTGKTETYFVVRTYSDNQSIQGHKLYKVNDVVDQN